MTVEVLHQRVSELEGENRLLRQKLDYFIKKYFGGTRSEKIDPKQLQLLMAGLEAQITSTEQTPKSDKKLRSASREKCTTSGRRALPENLETQEVVIEPKEVEQEPDAWKFIGNVVTEELDLLPAKFIKRLYIRRKYVSKEHEDLIVIGELPNRLIDKGIAGVGLLTHVILSKFADHLPLYRQEKIFEERYDIEISRKRMADWVRVVADWLKPVYEVMKDDLMKGNYLQVDETPIRYLDRDEIEGSRQGYLWSYGRPGGDVVFDWRTSRSRDGPEKFLGNYKGLLQTDGYGVYGSLARQRQGVVLVGCWAHARRKFVEAMDDSPKRAGFLVHLIAKLYQTEKELRKMDGVDRAYYRRENNAQPLRVMEKLLLRWKSKVPPKTRLGEAISYTLGQWENLIRVIDYSEVEIDNNHCENSIRPSALGKKNWLFVGHPDAGWRTAVIYSILQSCRRHGIEPHQYLTDILAQLPNLKITEIRTLTPSAWKSNRAPMPTQT
jgi:transposase